MSIKASMKSRQLIMIRNHFRVNDLKNKYLRKRPSRQAVKYVAITCLRAFLQLKRGRDYFGIRGVDTGAFSDRILLGRI